MNIRVIMLALIAGCLAVSTDAAAQEKRYSSIRPGELWLDTEGKPIHAHGFQIFEHEGTYYWYGENKEHTKLGSNVWTYGIRAYRSTDFYNWEDLGLIIHPDTMNALSPLHFSQTLDRPHILHNKKTGKWVCWIKSMDTDGYFVVLQADRFTGPYKLVRSFKPEGFGVGDFDMYADPETGNAYVWFERPHWEMICAELTEDYLGTNGKFSEHFIGIRPPFTREAPAHFMRHGKHFMFTSGTTGYVPNPSQVAVFTDPHGDYTDLGCPHIDDKFDDSFGSQITCVIKIPGRNLYVALADRWLPSLYGTDVPTRTIKAKEKSYLNHKPFDRDFSAPQVKDKTGVKRNKWDATDSARYVFLPITFDATGKPTIIWRDEWRIEDYPISLYEEVGAAAMPENIAPIKAPFDMPQLQRPEIKDRRYTVKMNGNGLSTSAIQKAIDRMSGQGGGRVIIPAGRWFTGRITLKGNVELHLEKGAELCFSGNVKDYQPAVFTRNEGIEMLSLGAMIYADGADNIAITGEGALVGPGRGCEIDTLEKNDSYLDTYVTADIPVAERLYDGKKGRRLFRPVFIGLMNCKNVLIEGVSIRQSIFWNIVPEYCDGVIIRGVNIDSQGTPRGDAIDIESTRNVLIEYCTVNTTDDAYTMKAGRGRDALRVNRPTENVVIRHCRAIHSAGGLAVGTEIGGGVRNIYVQDCDFENVQHGIYLKTNRLRGGGGNGITVDNIRITGAKHVLYCDMLGSQKWVGEYAVRQPDAAALTQVADLTPEFRDITLSRIKATGCGWFIKAKGLPERPIRNLSLRDIQADCDRFIDLQDIVGLTIRDYNVKCHDTDAAFRAVELTDFQNVVIQ